VGCDQLIVLEPPTDARADVFMRIYNPDGGEAGACGNATRCVASVVMDERKTDQVTVQTISGLLESQKVGTAPTACR
jgi:diaminopimelate epimerase